MKRREGHWNNFKQTCYKWEGEGEKREKGGETRKMEADVVDTLPSPNPLYDKFGWNCFSGTEKTQNLDSNQTLGTLLTLEQSTWGEATYRTGAWGEIDTFSPW